MTTQVLSPSDRFIDRAPAETERDGVWQRDRRDAIRAECRAALLACAMDQQTAMSREDAEEYFEKGLTEEALRFAESEADKTKVLEQYREEYVPRFVQEAEELGLRALGVIETAERAKWIRSDKAAKWRRKMKEKKWLEKRDFIAGEREDPEAQTLRAFARNWERIAREYKEARKLEKELGLQDKDIRNHPDLKDLHDPKFMAGTLDYLTRRPIVDRALAFLRNAAARKERTPQNGREIEMLRSQVQDRIAALGLPVVRQTIRSRLEQILQKAAPEKKQEINATFLRNLLANWPRIREFVSLEERRKKEGTPMSFNFVSMQVFLWEWNSGQRDSYLKEADRRFIDIAKEREDFISIRHALDTKDWEEAEELIETAKQGHLSPLNAAKLLSMERFLQEHRPPRKESKEKKPNDREVVDEARALLGSIPPSQRLFHAECMRLGYDTFRAMCSGYYNRVWLHRNRNVDTRTEMQWREEARLQTPGRIENGHNEKGWEANETTGANNTGAAIRDQERIAAPQIIFSKEESARTNAQKFWRNRRNWKFWYWTALIPLEGDNPGSYAIQEGMVLDTHPRLKRLCREMEKRNILFTQNGDVEYSRSPVTGMPEPSRN
ncbi:MAG: hypothetical protein PHW10_03670 [Candidatus Peribacteraceae bacterium]|nr:hypothetical protein [Candidatus Peribacteraceae bacterium]